MNKKVLGLIITGSKAFKKLSDRELESYDTWFFDYKRDIEREIGRKLTRKEEERLYKAIAWNYNSIWEIR